MGQGPTRPDMAGPRPINGRVQGGTGGTRPGPIYPRGYHTCPVYPRVQKVGFHTRSRYTRRS